MEPIRTPTSYANLTFITQIVRTMVDTMKSALAPTALIAPVLVVTTPIDIEVALVRTIKSIREMGCEPFLGD